MNTSSTLNGVHIECVSLQKLPLNWQLVRLKNVLSQPVTDGPHTTPNFIEHGIPFLSVDGIQDGELVFEGCRFISESDHAVFSMKTAPRRDDILMGKAASIGKIARVKKDIEFSIWSPLALIRLKTEVNPSFVEYALKSVECQVQIENLATSNTQKNISMGDIPRIAFRLPPRPRQDVITDFLDRETAKIDALVAEQERLIALIKEKRQAVISHAVTKGLDASVPMKDSGVDWIGKMPDSWQIKPLKRVANFVNGAAFKPSEWSMMGVPIIRIQNLNGGEVFNYFDGEVDLRHHVQTGDLLFGWSGNRGTSFGPFVWAAPGKFYLNQHIFKVCDKACDDDWLYWCLKAVTSHVEQEAHGIIGMVHVTKGKLGGVGVPYPDIVNQRAISSFLNRVIGLNDALIKEAEDMISTLSERRSALISAAVFGKIDVRGVFPTDWETVA